MKKILLFLSLLLFGGAAQTSELDAVKHTYKFTMYLEVPRVHNNMQSLGYRKYQRQTIVGELSICYPTSESEFRWIEVTNLVNKTHKDSKGKNVTYDCLIDEYFILNLIGDNKKDTFTTPSFCMDLVAEPSYSIGTTVNEDNALYLKLSGTGSTAKVSKDSRIIKYIRGYVAGTLGCGCTDYGHKSPTRVADAFGPSSKVHDVASVQGRFTLKYKGTSCIRK